MAAEGPPAPSPRTPGTAVPPKEAALPAVEAETPQDPSQTQGSVATHQGESQCLEEFILNYAFTACDPKQTGMVLAQRVVEYLQTVTGQSSEEGQLQALHRMLDPEAAGVALDLPTFHAIMREWIASCRQEGSVAGDQGQNAVPCVPASTNDSSCLPRGSWLAEEQDTVAGDLSLVLAAGEGCTVPAAAQLEGDGGNTDITSLTEAASLRSRAKQLAAQNATLQRDAESAEELNACLAEEMAQLKAQLRCSQQALEQARAVTEELEDLKAAAKGLEEENGELRRQARQLEKEQRCLCLRADGLQEENQQLLAECHGLREQIQVLAAEMADLEDQLCHCTALLSSRDAALAQELRLETTRLCDQLGRMQVAWAMWPWCPLGEADAPAQPLGAEIRATCRETGEVEEDAGTAVPSAPAGDGKEPAEPCQCPGPSERPLRPRALLALLLLLALLALLCLLPRRWLGLPHGRAAWAQLQLCYQRLPPQ